MPVVLRLDVVEAPGGAWDLLIVDAERPPVRVPVAPAAVVAVGDAVRALDALATGGGMIPGRDRRVSEAEERVGRALAAAAGATPAAREALARGHERARAASELLVLVVHARGETLDAVPWELLAIDPDGPVLESTGEGLVMREVAGGRAEPRSAREAFVAGAWSPTPDDPTCAALLAELARIEARAGRSLGGSTAAVVLHLVAHGEVAEARVGLALGDRDLDAASVAHGLGERLREAGLVVLDVCLAAPDGVAPLAALGPRAVRAGARSVVAPAVRFRAEALGAFADAAHRALAEGMTPARAVLAGRAAVRAMGHPHPSARWRSLRAWVATAQMAGEGPLVDPFDPRLTGVRPAADARAWLRAAEAEAARDGQGFFGVEHLARGLVSARPEGAVCRSLAGVLGGLVGRLAPWAHARVGPVAGRSATIRPTPRVESLLDGLPDGFRAEALAAALAAAEGPLRRLGGEALLALGLEVGAETGALGPSRVGLPPPAGWLEVLGGPEDGRELRPAPGEVLGRCDPTAPDPRALYAATWLADGALSRRAVVWLGGGRVQALAPARLRAGAGETPLAPGDAVTLAAGEELVLGAVTVLVGRG